MPKSQEFRRYRNAFEIGNIGKADTDRWTGPGYYLTKQILIVDKYFVALTHRSDRPSVRRVTVTLAVSGPGYNLPFSLHWPLVLRWHSRC